MNARVEAMSDAELLTHWYGSVQVAQMVLDGKLGSREQCLARARAAAGRRAGTMAPPPIRPAVKDKAASKEHSAGRGDSPFRKPPGPKPMSQMVQRVVPAPVKRDTIVASALRSMPDFQRAWTAGGCSQ